MDTTTPPPVVQASAPKQGVRVAPIIRDVVIVWVLTAAGGFYQTLSLAGQLPLAEWRVLSAMAAAPLSAIFAFTIAGYLAPPQRWRHLGFVALGTWITSLTNVLFFGVTIGQWIGGAIIVAIYMVVGGGLSYIFKRATINKAVLSDDSGSSESEATPMVTKNSLADHQTQAASAIPKAGIKLSSAVAGKPSPQVKTAPDDLTGYELLAAERQNGFRHEALWFQCHAEAEGDEIRAEAFYNRKRASALATKAHAELEMQQNELSRERLEEEENPSAILEDVPLQSGEFSGAEQQEAKAVVAGWIYLAILLLVAGIVWIVINQPIPIEVDRSAAESGNIDAQFRLGMAYKTGDRVPQDNAKALEWFSKAAMGSHQGAKLELQEPQHLVPQR